MGKGARAGTSIGVLTPERVRGVSREWYLNSLHKRRSIPPPSRWHPMAAAAQEEDDSRLEGGGEEARLAEISGGDL